MKTNDPRATHTGTDNSESYYAECNLKMNCIICYLHKCKYKEAITKYS